MTASHRLRLGTRSSPLAMAQAEEARARLCAAHGWEESAVELVPVLATGDKVQDRPLAEIGGKALWTKELDQWLYEGQIDAAVHSMKDVETIRPDWLAIAAILPRADTRDVLFGAPSIAELPQGARIGTSAPRRAAQMLHARPDCTIVPFRGNVATRLGKLAAGEADATLLAAAGLERLGQAHEGVPLPLDAWLPAPAQGAIGIECRAEDAATRALLTAIDDGPSRARVMAERMLLLELGGNCHSPIAVRSEIEGAEIVMHAALFTPDGTERVDGNTRFPAADPAHAAALAVDLLARATPAVRVHFSGSA